MAQDLATVVHDLARPLAEDVDLELVDVDISGGGGRIRVKVIVDRKGGDDVGSCRTLSKALSRQLDQEDLVSNRYTLEVTSPGTDRPLTDQRSFDRIEGRKVAATIRSAAADADADAGTDSDADESTTTVVEGTVVAANADVVVLQDDAGDTHEISYTQIVKATQVLRW